MSTMSTTIIGDYDCDDHDDEVDDGDDDSNMMYIIRARLTFIDDDISDHGCDDDDYEVNEDEDIRGEIDLRRR